MSHRFAFDVTHRDGGARRGELVTPHGRIETPAFMPVGTQAAVKAITHRDLSDLGAGMILANTYHLHLRPGDHLIADLGGLHRFMGWSGPILTDSGGYQVFSLAGSRTVGDEGVAFRSHLDGRLLTLTPESAAEIQARLGSDIAMVLDECTEYPVSADRAAEAMRRTHRWARRARDRFDRLGGEETTNPGQVLFGIVQGGVFPSLRRESAERTVAVGFAGYAIGGLSVGEPPALMYDIVAGTTPCLPEDCPRYLMGTGMPDDLFECVARGIDLFDCVLPTRNARNGQLLTRSGPLSIKNARFSRDEEPPDPDCSCYTCRHFSRAYLRHLYVAGEMSAATLNTLHNLHFYLDTMKRIREAIVFGSFENLRREFHDAFARRPVIS